MTDLISAALFERDEMVLTALRRADRPPFAGQWVLPMTVVGDDETAEDAVRRHAREQFGTGTSGEVFVDTVYLQDPADARRFVANIFRTAIGGGPMRFRADGDYDDARWLRAADLELVPMPPALREPLIRIMTEPDAAPQTDWPQFSAAESAQTADGQAVPLGESTPKGIVEPPDNRAGWDAISKAYQDERFGELYGERFMWSFVSSEDDMRVLDDVRGKRVLVLGCGGGQDCVALAKMGAIAIGIDPSAEQIAYAKMFASRHGADNASFVEGTAEDLSRFDDESFDLVVSSHALNYVPRIDRAVGEAHRVLRGGGTLAFSVTHPFTTLVSAKPPYFVERSYWDETVDWGWRFEGGASARFRQWFPTFSRWVQMLTDATFALERIIEPREDGREPPPGSKTERDPARAAMVPNTIIFKARKR